jgi:DNA invertase Pin-like site-specific DNA recombinase
MYLKNSVVEDIVMKVLKEAGINNAEALTQEILQRLTKLQKEIALKGSKLATPPTKPVNMKKVQKQLDAGIDQTTIAAGQKISVSTLQKRLKGRK